MRMRNRLHQLKRNRLRIGRAIPAIIDRSRQGLVITPRQRVFGLGQRAHVDAAHRARLSKNFLRDRERCENLIVLWTTGGKDATHMEFASRQLDGSQSVPMNASRKPLAK